MKLRRLDDTFKLWILCCTVFAVGGLGAGTLGVVWIYVQADFGVTLERVGRDAHRRHHWTHSNQLGQRVNHRSFRHRLGHDGRRNDRSIWSAGARPGALLADVHDRGCLPWLRLRRYGRWAKRLCRRAF